MLLDVLELEYAYVGFCMVENPRWFSLVLRTVGLMGDGDTGTGEMGDRMGVMVMGDFIVKVGRPGGHVVAVEMLKDNLGLVTLEASMVAID